jgi:hypothetical protein
MIGVQIGLLWGMPMYFIVMFVVPAVEALAAGSLWRRYRRPWPVTVAYVERVIPLAVTLILVIEAVPLALALPTMASQEWQDAAYQPSYWLLAVAPVLVVAQVATWRGWSWWLRLLLHAGWIVLLSWANIAAALTPLRAAP